MLLIMVYVGYQQTELSNKGASETIGIIHKGHFGAMRECLRDLHVGVQGAGPSMARQQVMTDTRCLSYPEDSNSSPDFVWIIN